MGEVIIAAVKPDLVPLIWPAVAPQIEKAVNYSNGELTQESLTQDVMNGNLILLTVNIDSKITASALIHKKTFESGLSVLNVPVIGGEDMHLWGKKLLTTLEQIAKEEGCKQVYGSGRPGWKRVMEKEGYKVIHTIMSREVDV